MFYQNNSKATKTFYGVTFKPGERKAVPGYINDKDFERCCKPVSKEPPKTQSKSTSQSNKSSEEKPKEEKPKEEPVDGTA